ncbi:D123-domain-containing protein [Ascobolus immersus RN42]|uniref:D123-domain-containing protein n=1 Tax=Ascobolus immersus RN42 TaxID=1160509 RepID=A0A3N4IL55_ASCIM|nr:D123-domain-containing protein [Ascobolus immersus RN42]
MASSSASQEAPQAPPYIGPLTPEQAAKEEARLDKLPFPTVTESHILNCSYPSWHHHFGDLTYRSLILPLPPSFLRYLHEDGIALPENENFGHIPQPTIEDDSDYYSGAQSDDDGDETETESEVPDPTLLFPDFHQQVANSVALLGGRVSVKLDWSAPQDANWILPGNTGDCRTAGEVYLLLKTSSFITFDLDQPYTECSQDEGVLSKEDRERRHLVLREWKEIIPAMEFRVWVRDRKIIGICQRDPNFYDYLEPMSDEIVDKIMDFYEDKIQAKFPDPNFTFDVYLGYPAKRVYLIDINPFAPRTDPILFSWMELLKLDPENIELPELRLVRKDDPEAWNYTSSKFSAHKMPLEVVNAGDGMHSMAEFAEKWKDILQKLDV